MKPDTTSNYHERILRALVHIQERLDEPLPLAELAGVACFSPFHFHRIFRGMVGESVKEHVRRLRLERAAHRLRFSSQPILDLALQAGYETHESFTRAFQTVFDETPSEFRKRHRVVAHGHAPSGVHFVAKGRLSSFRAAKRKGGALQARIETLAPVRVVFVRHVGTYSEVGSAWSRLMSWAGQRGLFAAMSRPVGIVHDDPEITEAGNIRYDAALPAPDGATAEGDIGVQQVNGGPYAVTAHKGPYATIGETYARLCGEWLPASGREAASLPALEFYLNSPMNAAPKDLLTEIWLPLEA